ncbi:MAG: hypothetical protein BAJATHORv1_20008 [Candidatus Thorarchaeota archaeon]|nr:MAG: hypothetical protein BAJATHORv1_20008 [Candidatus Thorarchaeota archaeon]
MTAIDVASTMSGLTIGIAINQVQIEAVKEVNAIMTKTTSTLIPDESASPTIHHSSRIS